MAALLRDRGFQVEIVRDLADLATRANSLHADGRLRAVVGVGGDGTAAELVNRTSPGVPVTMLPGGTENLLARYLHMGPAPGEVCETICSGRLLHLDAGMAAGRVFLLMVSCGFDADVVERLHRARAGHIRHLSYARPIWESLRRYTFPELRVYCTEGDGPESAEEESLLAGWVFAFNLPCYGGGFRVAPQADGTDGLLDMCAFRRHSLWHGLRYLAAVVLRRHQRMKDCAVRRIRRMRVTASEPVPYQVDGDPGGMLPLEVEVLPGRLTVVVPAAAAT